MPTSAFFDTQNREQIFVRRDRNTKQLYTPTLHIVRYLQIRQVIQTLSILHGSTANGKIANRLLPSKFLLFADNIKLENNLSQ